VVKKIKTKNLTTKARKREKRQIPADFVILAVRLSMAEFLHFDF